MASSFEKQAIQLFECPVCFNYMSPPIHQCSAGHSLCEECFYRINVCPLCRGPKAAACAYILERMYLQLTFPCKYAIEGCEVTAKGLHVKGHEATCQFATRLCPLRHEDGCQWQGTRHYIVEHCVADHPQFIYFEEFLRLVSESLRWEVYSRHSSAILNVYNTVFRLYWRLEGGSGLLRFAVNYYGDPSDEDKFSYEISVVKAHTDVEVIKLKASCLCLRNDNLDFVSNNYIMLHFDMIRQYCTEDGDLHYVVRLFKNEPNPTMPEVDLAVPGTSSGSG